MSEAEDAAAAPTTKPATVLGTAKKPRRYNKARMEAFSDGVFAFAITLLVLDIVIPDAQGGRDLLGAFFDQWPEYLAYVVSFATIGAIWLAHNAISEELDHVDSTYLRLNLVLLLFVAFTPFPTRFLAQYIQVEHAERVAVTIYGLAFVLLAAMVVILWLYARKADLIADRTESPEAAANSQRLPQGLIAYPVLIIVGLFWPLVAVFGYLALALYFMIPFRIRGRRRTEHA